MNNYTDEHESNLNKSVFLLSLVCSMKFYCTIKQAESIFSFFFLTILLNSSKFGARSRL